MNTPKPAYNNSAPRWDVCLKGGHEEGTFEISVVRSDNHHGRRSYGWFDDKKLLISHNGGPCQWSVTKFVWGRLVLVAEETAARLNAEIEEPKE